MASIRIEICVVWFIALFLVAFDALQFEKRVGLYSRKNTPFMMEKHNRNGYMDKNTLEDKQFFIHLEIQNFSTNHSDCFSLRVNGNTSSNVVQQKNCSIIINKLDNNTVPILNSIDIFCREDETFKHQATIEQTENSHFARCKSLDTFGEKYRITTTDANATFAKDFLASVCENKQQSKSMRKSSSCVLLSKNYVQYEKEQCCTGSFHFIPRGAFQIEVVMLWVDKHHLSHIIEVCFAVSFVCLIIIFASGVVSKRYRSERGNQILIHFAFSIFIQIVLHVIACFIRISPMLCDLQSVSFHYFTLVESCWTSIIAYLQYKRFVKVFDKEPNHLILKLCALAYISPIFPISLWIFYHDSNIELVNYLTFGLPEFIILITNSTFLMLITKNIVFVKNEYIEHKKSLTMEVKLIFFLFFVLDFSWFQIILAHLTSNKIFVYFFLFTQATQGFMLFFVFGIMNEHNRLIYKKFFGKIFRM